MNTIYLCKVHRDGQNYTNNIEVLENNKCFMNINEN